MGEVNMTEIKTLNGYPLADTKAREDIVELSREIVKVTPQELTADQKAQARANIGAIGGENKTVSGYFVQIGSGDIVSYRINIAPNTFGVSEVYLYTRGKNMLDFFAEGAADTYYEGYEKTVGGVTVKIQNGYLIATGESTAEGWNYFFKWDAYTNNVGYVPAGTYSLPSGMTAQFVDVSGNHRGTFTLEKGAVVHNIFSAAGKGDTVNVRCPLTMLRDTQAPTEYIPYKGAIYQLKLSPNVCYGGYIDSESGKLVNTHGADGNELAQPVEVDLPNILLPTKLDGETNMFAASVQSAFKEEEISVTTSYNMEQTINDLKEVVAKGGSFDCKAFGLPILYLTGKTNGMNKDNAVDLQYEYDGMTGIASVKWQGASSLNWAKKNYTIKFDEAFEAKEGWGTQKKYCFKANYIDHSHARNICSCKLWGEIVKSRTNVPSELAGLVNGGAIDGFPCIIMLNGEFHGLYTWNIPKDGWMFGSPKAILCADAHSEATKFKALATLNGDFELEYVEDEENADWVLPSLNNAIQAAMGGNIETLGQYIDIPSAIDYFIHTVDENAEDGTDKNYILVTFDGTKWYFSAYDRDTIYGLYWDGTKFITPASPHVTYARYAAGHQVMNLIYNHKRADLKARAVELREGVKSEANVDTLFTNFIGSIPSQIYDEDARKWPTIPNTSASNLAQILNWYRVRRAYIDKEIDGWT